MALAALAIGLAAAGGWQFARASAPVSGPIILISVDSLRADHLPVYGYERGATPTIDALAKGGVVFDRAYTHSPQTLPAYASLLTGRLPFETGVRDDVGFHLARSERTLPEMLHDRDFATGAVVSSFLLRRGTGVERGFGFFDDTMPPEQLGRPIEHIERDGAESEAIAEHWLESQDSSRVFLFLQLNEPQAPRTPPAAFAPLGPYDGEVAYADQIIGRLVHALKAHQLYDRSTIIVTSDHGEGLGDHGEQEHGLLLYDEDIRVPLIIKPAGGEGAGRRVAGVVQLVDIAPTVLDLARAPRPGDLRGVSLTSVIDGNGSLPPRMVYAESWYGRDVFGWSPLVSVTDGRRHYIQAPQPELYDLADDPHEQRNIAGAGGADLPELRAAAAGLLAGVAPAAPQARPDDDGPLMATSLGRTRFAPARPDGEAPPAVDPKDAVARLERYRTALDSAAASDWAAAIDGLQRLLQDDPDQPNVWFDLASIAARSGRVEQAATALGRVAALRPEDPDAALDLARALSAAHHQEAARIQAEAALRLAGDDRRAGWRAHVLLVDLALAAHDPDGARRQAADAEVDAPAFPLVAVTEARILASQGQFDQAADRYDAALPQVAVAKERVPGLRSAAAETYIKLERYDDGEAQLVAELRDFPDDIKARGELAQLYQATDRAESAGRVLTDLVAFSPTPDGYALAARLWTAFGDRARADEVRAAARRYAGASRSTQH